MKSNSSPDTQPSRTGRCVLASYPGVTRVYELYDFDDRFADSLRQVVGPDFEYPDYSHKTIAQVLSAH